MAGTSSKRVRLSTASCPSCGVVGSLRRIIYGMPGLDFDHERYISGGCVVTDNDPDIGCTQCDWYGLRKDLVWEM